MSLDNIVATIQSLSEESNKLSENEEANLYVYLADKDTKLGDVEKLLNLCKTNDAKLVCLKGLSKKSASNPPKALTTEISNPPETVESLRKYEKKSGQAQKWPASMDDIMRSTVFFYLADESALEYDDESALNLIFFYNNIDKGTFDEHKDGYVLVHKQEVKKYGTSKYTSKELEDLEDEMPGAIYLPVDKSRRDNAEKSPSARTVSAHRAIQEHIV
ncbi:hypothetical protein C1646_757191 [Rhizophagus diaphanus]|nr:hypothetical protein C1646_757191 [Rhizophagus diaphanus] [Rhizophagus sp. MUCL 43196]